MARIKNTRQIMEVMQAYLAGKKIEKQYVGDNGLHGSGLWYEVKKPSWDWAQWDFRVKQEPREFHVVIDRDGVPIGVAPANKIIPVSGAKIMDAKIIKVKEVLE